jgi:glutaredoxin 2
VFESSQVRFTARKIYAYIKNIKDILNSSSPLKEKNSSILPKQYTSEILLFYLLPNFLIFEKCDFLSYYAKTSD